MRESLQAVAKSVASEATPVDKVSTLLKGYTSALTDELSKTSAYTPGQQTRVKELLAEALENAEKFA